MITNVTIGTDPEMFLIDRKIMAPISAVGRIPGTKKKPYHPKELRSGYAMQTDNVLIEFNIPPKKTAQGLIASINTMKNYISDFVHNINPYYDIRCASSLYFNEHELESDQAKEFGCDADFNCYTEKPNPKPEGDKTNLRTAGCHWHIGYDNPNEEESVKLVKYLDLYLGVPSVLHDGDVRRRELYGKAGCFRFQPWGVEYRTLSGLFISSDDMIRFCYNQIKKAIDACNSNAPLPDPVFVIDAINNGNTETAQMLIRKYKI